MATDADLNHLAGVCARYVHSVLSAVPRHMLGHGSGHMQRTVQVPPNDSHVWVLLPCPVARKCLILNLPAFLIPAQSQFVDQPGPLATLSVAWC